MRDPSRIPTHHGVFHFREREYACVHARAYTRAKSPHTRARPCVHLSTFVSIACEKRRGEKRPALQRVVQILSDRSRRIRRFERRFRSRSCVRSGLFRDVLGRTAAPRRATPRRDYSIAPAVRTLRFHKIAFEARNDAASRKDLSLESLPLVGIQNIYIAGRIRGR